MVIRSASGRAAVAAAAFALGLTGCGYVGDPLPPLINVPDAVKNLAAIQRGDRVIVQFTVPTKTTEKRDIRGPLQFDLRALAGAVSPFNNDTWAAAATKFPPGKVEKGIARYELPVNSWAGQIVTIGARVVGANGKSSNWSNFANIAVVAPPEVPQAVQTEATANGVRVSWSGADGTFRVLRKAPGETDFREAAQVKQREWIDTAAQYGQQYAYIVQRLVPAGESQAESELSAQVTITPRDTFPPSVPGGLRASAAAESIELTWDRSPEPDVAAYRIYRASNGDFERIGEVTTTTGYSDRTAESGRTYRYAVTAVDAQGNESAKSAEASASR